MRACSFTLPIWSNLKLGAGACIAAFSSRDARACMSHTRLGGSCARVHCRHRGQLGQAADVGDANLDDPHASLLARPRHLSRSTPTAALCPSEPARGNGGRDGRKACSAGSTCIAAGRWAQGSLCPLAPNTLIDSSKCLSSLIVAGLRFHWPTCRFALSSGLSCRQVAPSGGPCG